MRSIKASEFKAHCLAILDEVASTGEPIVILKRGRPVARLVPPEGETYPQYELAGTVKFLGDVMEPVLAPEDWEAELGDGLGATLMTQDRRIVESGLVPTLS